jgi:hypothetical protein
MQRRSSCAAAEEELPSSTCSRSITAKEELPCCCQGGARASLCCMVLKTSLSRPPSQGRCRHVTLPRPTTTSRAAIAQPLHWVGLPRASSSGRLPQCHCLPPQCRRHRRQLLPQHRHRRAYVRPSRYLPPPFPSRYHSLLHHLHVLDPLPPALSSTMTTWQRCSTLPPSSPTHRGC